MAAIQIIQPTPTAPRFEVETPEVSIRLKALQWVKKAAPTEETRLVTIIQQAAPHAERIAVLLAEWESEDVSDEEGAELVGLLFESEQHSTRRTEAVLRLSELRALPFEVVWKQMIKGIPAPFLPALSRLDG